MHGQYFKTYVRHVERFSVGIQIPPAGDAHAIGWNSHPGSYVQNGSRVPQHIEAGQEFVFHSQDATNH